MAGDGNGGTDDDSCLHPSQFRFLEGGDEDAWNTTTIEGMWRVERTHLPHPPLPLIHRTTPCRRRARPGMTDAERFHNTCSALNLINVTGEGEDGGLQTTLWRAIAGTLFLGQAEFSTTMDDQHVEGSVSRWCSLCLLGVRGGGGVRTIQILGVR